jgi:RHS repeat-associated protein
MNRLIPYYRARYYSPTMGRFISRDPLENAEQSQEPNLYLCFMTKSKRHN